LRTIQIVSALSCFAVLLAATLDKADLKFVTNASEGGLAEVKLGELAKEKGSITSVTSFGEQMVKDHTNANNELKSLVSGKGITVSDSMNAKDQALYDRLSKLSGSTFDRAYMNAMVKDHQEDVAEFLRISKTSKDADIKAFAAKTLPTLEHHLQMAEQSVKVLGTTSVK
jgi:putative membrane protein